MQIGVLKELNRYVSNSSKWIQIWFTSSEPDFFAISKMVHYISVPQKLPKLSIKIKLKWTFCLITLSVIGVQKCNAPFWKWHKNRVQMQQTISGYIKKLKQFISVQWFFSQFCKNVSDDHIHPSIFSNRVSFFPQESILSTDNVLDLFHICKIPKIAKMCKIFILLL